MPMHPLPILLNSGIPVALSSDSPSGFGNMGLTYDFFQVKFYDDYLRLTPPLTRALCSQVLVSSEITGLSTLGVLARDSIEVRT